MRDPRRLHRLLLNASFRLRLPCVVALMWTIGCGSASTAVGHGTSTDNAGPQALNQLAGELLVSALNDRATEAAALREFRMAGAGALPWILRATDARSRLQPAGTDDALMAELRDLRATYGDQDAIDALRESTPSDPVALAIRLRWIVADNNRPELITALRHSSERVRLAALRQLRHAQLEVETALEVSQIARLDPVASVRASALETIAIQGTAAIDVLTARLADSDATPRSVAMRELARIDCTHAHSRLASWLSGAPSRDSLAAVRALVPCGAATIAQLLVPLQHAMASSDVALRAEAATTADLLSWRAIPDWIATPLAHDPVPAVRLALALALIRTHEATARATLTTLMQAPPTMVGVQAAAILVSGDDAQALSVLLDARSHRDPLVRRVAFVALGRRTDQVSELAVGLRDHDVSVQLAAAGALLRVTHAML